VNSLSVSVVIPTHNRAALLRELLDGLSVQSYPLQQVEVIVVADGCRDGTWELLQRYEAPYKLSFHQLPGMGAATARNHGAQHASGNLLLFLDDDIQPAPQLIEAHASIHLREQDCVVMGYLPPIVQSTVDFFQIELRSWWEAAFEAMGKPGHRFTYTDLLSGNFSLRSLLFHRVGGFDVTLQCREDYELGARLLQAGAQFKYAPNALGYHCETTDLPRSLQRKYNEGRADIAIGRLHPDLKSTFLLARLMSFNTLLHLFLQLLVFWQPGVGDRMASLAQWILMPLEFIRLRKFWRIVLNGLLGYWYLRGIADGIGSRRALFAYMKGVSEPFSESQDSLVLDLLEGLERAEYLLDLERPAACRIYHGDYFIGYIPPQPGAERLRGAHLRPWLIEDAALTLFVALTAKGNDRLLSSQVLWRFREKEWA
jgi:glycosyltransferase involved in cell wall biosynthesis